MNVDAGSLARGAGQPAPQLPQLPPRRLMLRGRLQLTSMALDVLMVMLAVTGASVLWGGRLSLTLVTPIATALCVLYLAIGLNSDTFAAEDLDRSVRGTTRALRTLLLSCTILIAAVFFMKASDSVSRATLLIATLIGSVLLVTERALFHFWMRRSYGSALHSEVLIVDGAPCKAPAETFVIDAAAVGLRCDIRDPMMLDLLGRLLANADRVVVSCPFDRRRDWAMMLKGANIQGEIVSAELNELGLLGASSFGGSATVMVSDGPLDLRQRMLKRALDVFMTCGALVALAPLLVLVAIAVKLDSSGPVFFVQQRVGRGNRLFSMYKFRSMRTEMCDSRGNRSTGRDDDRVTRVGRFIRATSIDELPQLLNVLKGDMSVVGPRPHALGSLAGDMLFWEVDERYWHRHACKPGLTGLAQVRGFRGATHQQLDLVNRLQADLEYSSGWTVWRDVTILIATLRVVVHRNAY